MGRKMRVAAKGAQHTMKNYFDLTGKVAVVTGAGSGLGAAAATCYAENGAAVALLARTESKIKAVAEKITAAGGRALPIPCDVTSEDSVKAAVEKVLAEYGKIDILLNDAGVAVGGGVDTLALEDWNRSMATNAGGTYLMSKYIIPGMRKQKYGKVINIASVNAMLADKAPDLWRHAYNASKAAVIGLTKGMAASYAIDNITVNAVCPALFKTEMTANTLFAHEGFMNMYNALTPAGRPGEEGEVNGTLLYFASDASSYVTGQYIYVDGGFDIV